MPSAVNNILYNIVDTYNKEEVIKAKKEHRKALLLPKIMGQNGIFYAEITAWTGAAVLLVVSYYIRIRKFRES